MFRHPTTYMLPCRRNVNKARPTETSPPFCQPGLALVSPARDQRMQGKGGGGEDFSFRSFLSSGCGTNYQKLEASTTHTYFSVLSQGSPRSRCWQIRCPERAHLLACRWLPFILPHRAESREASSLGSYKGTDSIHDGSTCTTPSNPNRLPQAPPPNTITLG